MARIKIEYVIDSLDTEDMKRALEAALEEVLPSTSIDRNDLFRAFKRAVGRKCSTYVKIPDQYVEAD
jgi:hypothetical protein